jgi:hypothetical protein
VTALSFDHRTGRMSDFDYYELLPSLRLEAAEALNLLVEVEQDARQRHVHGRPPQPAEIDRDLEVASPR